MPDENTAVTLWRRFLELTERQTALIRDGDADALGASLDERAAVIAALEALGDVPPSDELDALIADATRQNAANAVLLRESLAAVNADIRATELSRRGVKGYVTNADYGGYDSFDAKL